MQLGSDASASTCSIMEHEERLVQLRQMESQSHTALADVLWGHTVQPLVLCSFLLAC